VSLDIFEQAQDWFSLFESLTYPDALNVILDMRKLAFVYPEAVVYLAAVADHLLNRSNAYIQEEKPETIVTDEYLQACGLRPFFNVRRSEPPAIDPQLFGDCIPISRETVKKESLAEKMADLINSKCPMDQSTRTRLGEALGEIIGNAMEHSAVAQWYRIAQIHVSRKRITIAIADNGVGVSHTLRTGYSGAAFSGKRDVDILKSSFLSNVTRYPPKMGEAHGGGLDAVKGFAQSVKAKIAMLSGRGLYTIDFGGETPNERLTVFPRELPGTLLVLRIPF
jgi:hypothetical protein